tara:strand:+ start:1675 stop:2244 length:570 start_codon:yes stop_codon:yes gene_type:complete
MFNENHHLSKSEIESALQGKDDFVKINYLRRFLERADNLEIKKFVLLNLANISEGRNLLKDAVKYIASAGDISVTYREKIEYFMKECELWIKMHEFDMAEKAFKKAFFYGNSQEKIELDNKYKELFWMTAGIEEKKGRARHAIKIYERALIVNKGRGIEISEKLISLYEKFGMVKEAEYYREKLELGRG